MALHILRAVTAVHFLIFLGYLREEEVRTTRVSIIHRSKEMIFQARAYFESVRREYLAVLFNQLVRSRISNDFIRYNIFSWCPRFVSWANSPRLRLLCGVENLSHCFVKNFNFLDIDWLRFQSSLGSREESVFFGFRQRQDNFALGQEDGGRLALIF